MRKIKEVLRLHANGWANRQIARSVGTAHSTIREYLRRADAAGLSWPLPEALSDSELEARLFPPSQPSAIDRPLPVWINEAETELPLAIQRLRVRTPLVQAAELIVGVDGLSATIRSALVPLSSDSVVQLIARRLSNASLQAPSGNRSLSSGL